jgi:carboxylesterase type B
MNLLGDSTFQPWAARANEAIGGFVANIIDNFDHGEEDCLFLDVHIPGKVLRRTVNGDPKRVPVVNWIYGGAFGLGSKEQMGLYNPTELLKRTDGEMIWVAGNYRLGTYGWLAGETMERESSPNIGLYDQRMVLQWIQDFISVLGGNKGNVLAMGESAGASSLFHHLVAFGGTQDPLFQRAVLMSPAYQIMWDRKGMLEDVFKNFTIAAGCKGQGLACARAASSESLRKANRVVQDSVPRGSFGVGPATDGRWVRQLASVEMLEGRFSLSRILILLTKIRECV